MATRTIIMLILFICPALFADETFTYIVKVKTLPNESDKIDLPVKEKKTGFTNIMDKGKTEDAQPFKITHKIQELNTDYTKVVVTPSEGLETQFFNEIELSGKIIKLHGDKIITSFIPHTGGTHTYIKRTEYNPLPADYGNDYSVKVSS